MGLMLLARDRSSGWTREFAGCGRREFAGCGRSEGRPRWRGKKESFACFLCLSISLSLVATL
jgi:hypothetical protein